MGLICLFKSLFTTQKLKPSDTFNVPVTVGFCITNFPMNIRGLSYLAIVWTLLNSSSPLAVFIRKGVITLITLSHS